MRRALTEEITSDDLNITSTDWQSYHTQWMGMHLPQIENVLINRPTEKADGAGETAITLSAAAIGNAIFDATGVRIREVPFTPERVKAALAVRS
jgi:nicotinate dehydrogenase subunit B